MQKPLVVANREMKMADVFKVRAGLGVAAVAVLVAGVLWQSSDQPEPVAESPDVAALTVDEHRAEDTVSFAAGEEQALYQRILADGIGVLDNRLKLTGDPKTKGYWEPAVNWPLIPMHATVLKDGRVLAFDSAQEAAAVEQAALHNKTRVAIWDPATDTITRRDANRGYEMFCSGFGNMSNGDLFVAGGNANRSLGGINKTHIFDTDNDNWSLTNNMAFSRWYTAVTPLQNGEMLITGGGPSTPEVRQTNGVIRRLNSATDSIWGNRAQHPWLQAAPNGGVYYLGPHDGMRWINTDGAGQVVNKGARGGGSRTYGNMVMYDKGKLLVVGGGNKNSSMVIDINGASPSVRNSSSMAYRRTHHNSTLLADGTVLATGGNTAGSLVNMSQGVYEAELWDPATEGWTKLAPMSFTRQYHSTALLLPDGRVFSGGGGLCGSCQINGYHYLNSELFLPPYLFAKDGNGELADRPAIIQAPTKVGYNASVYLNMETDLPIAKLVMIRPGSTTHAINMEQRAVPAPFVRQSDGRLRWTTPTDASVAPPGNYMLFAVDTDGVPSVARMINVGNQSTQGDALQLANPGFQKVSDQEVVDLPVKGFSSSGLTLSYTVSGLPRGLSLNSANGVISGTALVAGKYNTVVTVRDSASRSSVARFRWEVIAEEPTGKPLTTGLLGYWPMYDNKADDVIGNKHGVKVGNTRFVDDAERGNVMSLDGSGDYLRITKTVNSASGSYSFWFKTDTPARGLFSTSTNNAGSNTDRRLSIDNTGIGSRLGGQITSGGTKNYADNQWHHLMYTHGTGGVKLYVDGQLLASGSQTASTQSGQQQLHLGSNPGMGSGRYFKGLMDDFRYYQRTVPGNEVSLLFDGEENKAPLLDTPANRREEKGTSVNLLLSASDPEGKALTYSASGLPAGVSINATTGRLSGTLSTAGNYQVEVTATDIVGLSDSQVFTWVVTQVVQVNRAPVLSKPAHQQSANGSVVSLTLSATDADGDTLSYSASGLPSGLSLNASTGVISGAVNSAGSYNVTATARDPDGLTDSESFTWTVTAVVSNLTVPQLTSQNPPASLLEGGAASYSVSATSSSAVQYAWSYGDGSAQSAWSASGATSHQYAKAGRYQITVQARDANGGLESLQFTQVVYAPTTARSPLSSQDLVLDEARNRAWVANSDNDTVTLLNFSQQTKTREIAVGHQPSSVALAANGDLWVANKASATLSVIDASTLAVSRTVNLAPASQPHSLIVVPESNKVFVSLEATGQVIRLNGNNGQIEASAYVAPRVRGLALNADRDELLVSRFVSPLLAGEHTANVNLNSGGGELYVLNASSLATARKVILPVSFAGDSETSGNGVPNYLGAPTISPDGSAVWVPSKQDNVGRGEMRSGVDLDHQSTVRAVVSQVSLSDWSTSWQTRVDLDNASMSSAAAFGPRGNYLLVALETSGELAIVDAYDSASLTRVKVGRAPQAVAVSADGSTAWVHNFVDRTVSVVKVGDVFTGVAQIPVVEKTITVVADEKLTAQVLLGKQFFYDASDSRLAREGYMSCASCHNDGDSDGRVWDFTQNGEGIRNTISLRGRGDAVHGKLHWAANFDEVQDFEGQVRDFSGGTGLMSDADFANTSDAMGNPKAGLSSDLDALAAYVHSLTLSPESPAMAASYSDSATRGRALFNSAGCVSCHAGAAMTDSPTARRHDVGTINAASGERRGEALDGLDTPTLLGLHETFPYLHNGSAATIAAAIGAHNTHSLSNAEVNDLQQYLLEVPAIGDDRAGETVLTSGNAVTGTVGQDEWHYYTFEAAADVQAIRVVLSGLSDDGDLYVRKGERPSGHSGNGGIYDASSTAGGTATERVLVQNADTAVWHIGVHGWRASDYTLVATAEEVEEPGQSTVLADDVSVTGRVDQGKWKHFNITTTGEHERVEVVLDQLGADVDLYVRAGAAPTGSVDENGIYDCHSTAGGSTTERCVINNTAATVWHIGVHGYRASSFRLNAKLVESTGGGGGTGENGTLSPTAPVSASVATGAWQYYEVDVPATVTQVGIRLSGLTADSDLYVRRDQRPSGDVDSGGIYDCGSYVGGTNSEYCELNTTGGAKLVVGVHGYRGSSYNLTAEFTTPDPVTVSPIANAEPIAGSVALTQWRFYRYTSSVSDAQLRFSLDGLTADADLYVRAGERPTGAASAGANADCVSWVGGTSAEECIVTNAGVTEWYVGVYGYQGSDYTLRVDVSQNRNWAGTKDYAKGKDVVAKSGPVVVGSSGGGVGGGSTGAGFLLILAALGLRRRRIG